MKRNDFIGVYDYKESDTFRPTLESRVHLGMNVSKTLTAREDSCCVILNRGGTTMDLRIRKLTPNECFKLMGVKSKDREKIKNNQSDASLYHLAGDSIVTTCLMAIFGELLQIDYQKKITEVIGDIRK